MYKFNVNLINGSSIDTIMPIRSFIVKEQFTFFYSQDNQQGYGVAVVANNQIQSIILEEG